MEVMYFMTVEANINCPEDLWIRRSMVSAGGHERSMRDSPTCQNHVKFQSFSVDHDLMTHLPVASMLHAGTHLFTVQLLVGTYTGQQISIDGQSCLTCLPPTPQLPPHFYRWSIKFHKVRNAHCQCHQNSHSCLWPQ
jgi:hypothetical protein